MKRYTKRLPDGQAVMDCQSCPESWMGKSGERCTALYCRNRLKNRVAAYEDTGLDPEDILSATDMAKVACALHELNRYKDLGSLERLREAVEKQSEYDQFMERWKQVAEIAGSVKQFGTERVAELVEADRDGRCIIGVCYCRECQIAKRETDGSLICGDYEVEPDGFCNRGKRRET